MPSRTLFSPPAETFMTILISWVRGADPRSFLNANAETRLSESVPAKEVQVMRKCLAAALGETAVNRLGVVVVNLVPTSRKNSKVLALFDDNQFAAALTALGDMSPTDTTPVDIFEAFMTSPRWYGADV